MRVLALVTLLALLACHEPVALADAGHDGLIEVRVEGIRLDLETRTPVLLLEELAGDRQLPIWIGIAEARSIAVQLEGEVAPRPNTHDLAKRLVQKLDGRLERVVVSKLEGGVFFARMWLAQNEALQEIDARPSDAIAIGLRMKAPLFVHPSLFEEAGTEGAGEGQQIRGVPRSGDRQLPTRRL